MYALICWCWSVFWSVPAGAELNRREKRSISCADIARQKKPCFFNSLDPPQLHIANQAAPLVLLPFQLIFRQSIALLRDFLQSPHACLPLSELWRLWQTGDGHLLLPGGSSCLVEPKQALRRGLIIVVEAHNDMRGSSIARMI